MTMNDQAAMNEQLMQLRLQGLSIDGDNRYKQDLIDAIIGAMMFGAQDANPPPAGHWLEQFYVIAREERGALARVEAEHEANGLEYGEALILIGQVLDCRTLEDLNTVRRYLNEFMDRYSLRPVPDVDLAQAEQQEAQGVQAGEFQREDRYIVIKRKDFYRLPMEMRLQFSMALRELAPRLPKREYLVVESDWPEYEPTWAAIQARVEGRAALATQPAEWVDPVALHPAENLYNQGFADGVAEAKRLNAVRGAEHE